MKRYHDMDVLDLEVSDVIKILLLKRRCLNTFIEEDHMDWLKGEIFDIKESIKDIVEHLQVYRLS